MAAEGGHLGVLQWARENGCPWDEDVLLNAARKGDLCVVQWTCENGLSLSADVFAQAARAGSIPVLEWLQEKECPWDERAEINARDFRRHEAAQWLFENGCLG